MNTPQRRSTKTPFRLTTHDKHLLNSEEYLNDTIINNTLQLFNAHFSNMKYHNTYFMEYVSNPNLPNASLPQWIGEISDSTNIWYLPINHQGIHWLYLQINPNTNMITQHDSLPTATNTDYTNRIGELLTNHNNIEWT